MIREWSRQTGELGTGFLEGKEATAAGVYHRLRMFFGEYFLDITDGTPWLQSILGKRPQDVAEEAIKQRIVTAPGVLGITAFTFDMDNTTRRITVDCTVIDVNNELVQIFYDGNVFGTGDITAPVPPLSTPELPDIINANQYTIAVED